MTYTENLWLFFLLLSGIIIVPGMDMVFVLASALSGRCFCPDALRARICSMPATG